MQNAKNLSKGNILAKFGTLRKSLISTKMFLLVLAFSMKINTSMDFLIFNIDHSLYNKPRKPSDIGPPNSIPQKKTQDFL